MTDFLAMLEKIIRMLAYGAWHAAAESSDLGMKKFPGGYICLYHTGEKRGLISEIEAFPKEKNAARSYHLDAVRRKVDVLMKHPGALFASDVDGVSDGGLRFREYIIVVTGYRSKLNLSIAVSAAGMLSMVGKSLSEKSDPEMNVLTKKALLRGVPGPLSFKGHPVDHIVGKEYSLIHYKMSPK